jgi:N6-adenosine-specific RNA methylase IME4
MPREINRGALAEATEADKSAAEQQPDLSTKSEMKWPATSSNKYGVIYADPPWPFKTYSAKGEGRGAICHYQCMSLKKLAALPVTDVAARNSVLLLWVVDPHLPAAPDLIEAWGFEFRTVGFYWAKINRSADPDQLSAADFFAGLGYWTRANVEQCLLATRGKPPRMAKDVRRLVISPRRQHSRKPDEIYGRIERLTRGPYLELFARQSRPGWDQLGAETGLFDNGPVKTRKRPSRFSPRMCNTSRGDAA